LRLLLVLLLLPSLSVAEPRTVLPENVLSAITADWNNDGQKDRAILVDNPIEGVAELYIYTGKDRGFFEHSISPEIAWSGSMWGQQPSLEINSDGDLLVKSTNHGMGRTRWFQTLTITYRNGAFVVARFNHSYYDSLDPNDNGECDINLLSGRGLTLRGEETPRDIILPARVIPASEWNTDIFPEECF